MNTPADEFEKRINADIYITLAAALKKLGEQRVTKKVYLFPDEGSVYRETMSVTQEIFTEYQVSRNGQKVIENLLEISFGRGT
jgi:hypothetical protein